MRYLTFLIMLAFGCGPSAEEKARAQKAREDSIRVATEHKIKMRLAIEDSIKTNTEKLSAMDEQIRYWKGELEVQKAKLEKIKKFQLLRLPEEKDNQIRTQVENIDLIEGTIENVRARMATTRGKIFDFQQQLKQYQ